MQYVGEERGKRSMVRGLDVLRMEWVLEIEHHHINHPAGLVVYRDTVPPKDGRERGGHQREKEEKEERRELCTGS